MTLKRQVNIPNEEPLVWFECEGCGSEVQENGESLSEPCWYCPSDQTCTTCGRGFCDQSC